MTEDSASALAAATDELALARAVEAARRSLAKGEFPVGAALAIGDQILDVAHNAIASNRSLIAHAEVQLLSRHAGALRSAWERGQRTATLYATLEPCLMCLSASVHSRIARVVFACRDPFAGGARTRPPGDWYRTNWPRLEHHPKFEAESAALLLRYVEGRAGWDAFRATLEAVLKTHR